MFRRPAWLCLRFASCVTTQQNATFWGAVHLGEGYDPQIRTRQRFLYNAPTPKFCRPMFPRSEVIVLTNPQADCGENIQCSSLRYDVE